MSKLYSIGELLIDFQSVGTGSLAQTDQFMKKAGGAPANVCAQAAKFGVKTVYLTKVGDDGFGEFLIDSLRSIGVDASYVLKDKEHNTSLAFVSLKENGEREFTFYRKNAADLELIPEDFKDVAFEKGDILEFGSVALASETSKKTHRFLIEKANKAEAIIAFDPNLRFNLWDDPNELRSTVLEFAQCADVMKVGKDELEFITGQEGEAAVKRLFGGRLKVLLVTDGGHGAKLYANGQCFDCKGYKVKAVDTTGAGDSFFGAFLGLLLKHQIDREKLSDSAPYQEMLELSCKAGAYTTMNYGAIPSMGNLEEIERKVQ